MVVNSTKYTEDFDIYEDFNIYTESHSYDEETGISRIVLITDLGKVIGEAKCHPDDKDMCGMITGATIAGYRATLNYFKLCKRKYKTRLKALDDLYYSMNQSKKFNKNSYENKMLLRHRQKTIAIIEEIQSEMEEINKQLKQYIESKENFFNKIREKRKAQK